MEQSPTPEQMIEPCLRVERKVQLAEHGGHCLSFPMPEQLAEPAGA